MGGAKDLNPWKLGRNPLEDGGSCKRRMSAREGPSVREENKERNTFQLPRLLCWMRVSFVAGASPWREVEREFLILSGRTRGLIRGYRPWALASGCWLGPAGGGASVL